MADIGQERRGMSVEMVALNKDIGKLAARVSGLEEKVEGIHATIEKTDAYIHEWRHSISNAITGSEARAMKANSDVIGMVKDMDNRSAENRAELKGLLHDAQKRIDDLREEIGKGLLKLTVAILLGAGGLVTALVVYIFEMKTTP